MKKYLDDILVVVGCGLVLYGTWKLCTDAVFLVAGVLCMTAGVVTGLSGGNNDRQ